MPKFARRGSDVHLTCKYDMDLGSVYAVKWYKGLQEFYRYVPKEVPPVQVFPLPGIHVEVNNHISILKNKKKINVHTKLPPPMMLYELVFHFVMYEALFLLRFYTVHTIMCDS